MLLALLAAPSAVSRLWSAVRQPLGGAALLFGVILIFSLLWTVAPTTQALRELAGWRVLLLMVVGLAIFDEREARERFAVWIVAYAALALTLAFAMLWLGRSIDGFQSPGIVLRNEATQAVFFAVSAALAVWLAYNRSGSAKYAYFAIALVLAVNVAFFGASRSGYVALVVMAIGVALSAASMKARVLTVLACAAAVVAVAVTSQVAQQRVMEGWQQVIAVDTASESSSMGVRLVFWRTSLDLIANRPLLGYGVGGFQSAYAEAVAERTGWRGIKTADPHNQFIFVTVAVGVIGLAAFAWLLICSFRQRTSGWMRAAGLSVTAAWCATSLFNSHFTVFNEGHLIALFWGALLAEDAR